MGLWGLVILIDIICLVHCVRHQKNLTWFFLILFFPLVGSLVYFFVEILPDLQNAPQTTQIAQNISRNVQPNRELERLKDALMLSDTVKNHENLADEYLRLKNYDEAIKHYRICLEGRYAQDVGLQFKLGEALVSHKDFSAAIPILQNIKSHSTIRQQRIRLLLARCYEEQKEEEKAENTYREAMKGHADMETKCRYAMFLKGQGETERANELLGEVLTAARRMSRHAQEVNQDWISYAKQHYQSSPQQ